MNSFTFHSATGKSSLIAKKRLNGTTSPKSKLVSITPDRHVISVNGRGLFCGFKKMARLAGFASLDPNPRFL